MLVIMRTTAAGPAGVYPAGQKADVPDATAKAWIAAGYACEAEPAAKPAPTPVPAAKRQREK